MTDNTFHPFKTVEFLDKCNKYFKYKTARVINCTAKQVKLTITHEDGNSFVVSVPKTSVKPRPSISTSTPVPTAAPPMVVHAPQAAPERIQRKPLGGNAPSAPPLQSSSQLINNDCRDLVGNVVSPAPSFPVPFGSTSLTPLSFASMPTTPFSLISFASMPMTPFSLISNVAALSIANPPLFELHVGNTPRGTPDLLLMQFLNSAMQSVGLCQPHETPILKSWDSKGFAFLDCVSAEMATKVLNINGIPFHGFKLKISCPSKYVGPVFQHQTWQELTGKVLPLHTILDLSLLKGASESYFWEIQHQKWRILCCRTSWAMPW